MADELTDEGLLERARGGDEAAFLSLYERYRAAVYRFAFRLLGSTMLAEDVAHDCFLSLLRQPHLFDPARASLRTYLYAAARNLALKQFRRQRGEAALDDCVSEPRAPEAEQPLDQLLAAELTEAVRNAIEGLPPLQREALVLFEYEELSLAEIAQVVGADVGTVKARLWRAREGLRKTLAPYLAARGAGVLRREKRG
ncbi:MAG: RNA polymerase sigma factor [Pyrinomonadaceae bacterium]